MLSKRAAAIALRYWAEHLGCEPGDLFSAPLRIVPHGGELAGYAGAFSLFREGNAIASLPPERMETLSHLLRQRPVTPASFANALGSVAAKVIGPAFIGYAEKVAPALQPTRALDAADAPALEALRGACDVNEWEHGGSDIAHPCSGVFSGGQLVALAGYEVWGGTIAHISIVTHPSFRGRDFGQSAVAHLTARALAAGLLPQYRTLAANHASMCIAERLGFRAFATSMAVRLTPMG